MNLVLSNEIMRKSDRSCPLGGRELMFRAGKAIFEEIRRMECKKGGFAVVCGTGNNAGDGYVVASLLHEHRISCTLYPLSNRFSEDGEYYFKRAAEVGVPTAFLDASDRVLTGSDLSDYDFVLDCILGTGIRGELRERESRAIQAICDAHRNGVKVISVDINSGLNGDNGVASEPCVISDLTISVGYYKLGHFLNQAGDVMKRKINRNIGIEAAGRGCFHLEASDFEGILPPRKHASNKSTYGYITVIAGSVRYGGAAAMACKAAMRAGAGVVRLASSVSVIRQIASLIPESIMYPLSESADGSTRFVPQEISALIAMSKSIAFGMGIDETPAMRDTLRYLLRHYSGTLVVDAGGLTLFAEIVKEDGAGRTCSLILTPHLKELSRMSGEDRSEIAADPVGCAERYARGLNFDPSVPSAVVLLKGAATVITDGSETLLVDAGCPGMATAGSGDVLSGVITALLGYRELLNFETAERHARALCPHRESDSQKKERLFSQTLRIAALGSYICGKAGELAQLAGNAYSMIAGDTVAKLPEVFTDLISQNDEA